MENNEELNLYSDNLKKIRDILNISVNELSSKIDIPERTILSYERKERLCSAKIITNLRKNLNINANWFVTGLGEMFIKNYSTIGERIESLTVQNNISKSQMAVMLNLQETDLDNIINGNKLPDLITINKLKQNFKISVDWLLYGE